MLKAHIQCLVSVTIYYESKDVPDAQLIREAKALLTSDSRISFTGAEKPHRVDEH